MHPVEIRNKINFNNEQIKLLMAPNTFVLNELVFNYLKENKKLQEQCTHEFGSDGYCVICDYYDAAHDEEEVEEAEGE